MAKGDKNKNPGCWTIGIAVVVICAIVNRYPWILILAAVLIAAAIGLSIWKKRKAKQAEETAPAAETPAPQSPVAADPEPQKVAAPEPEKPKIKVTEYSLKGVFAHEDDIFHNLMQVDPDYEATKKELVDLGMTDHPIYKWTPKKLPLELLPEPDNQYDSDAIKAVADGITIGYIPKEKTAEVRGKLAGGRITRITYEITGGNYKQVDSDYDWEKDKYTYTISTGHAEISARVYVTESAE